MTPSYVQELNRIELLEEIKRYKKLEFEKMTKDEFKRKDYFSNLNLEDVRLKFKQTSKVIPTVRSHFKRKYKERSLKCPSCKEFRDETTLQEELHSPSANIHPLESLANQEDETSQKDMDTSFHLLYRCPAFREFRINKNFDNDQDLCDFLRQVIEYRMENHED